MSWGNKLIVAFVLFAALIGTLVYKSVHSSFDLVSKDYYKDELRYQDKIDAQKNASKFSEVVITQSAELVNINFPKELAGKKVEGEAWFYCSTDASKDKKIKIIVNNKAELVIPKNQLAKAVCQVKISWKIDNNNYYSEKNITIQ
jgi:hypothetical protein